MEKVADMFKHPRGCLGFKEGEEFAFFFPNVAFQKIPELGNLGGNAGSVRVLKLLRELLHGTMVPQEIFNLC